MLGSALHDEPAWHGEGAWEEIVCLKTRHSRSRTDAGGTTPTGRLPSPAAPPQTGPDLQGLFIMLASSALVNLGEAADPETGERVLDLAQAREAIDLLSLLRLKTEGNRTEQESHLLEEILYDLQLRFVQAAKGQAAKGTAGS
jgi:hypothetical protein